MEQVINIFSMRKLVAYRIGRQQWCKKEGNKGLLRRGNVIVLYISHTNIKSYKWVNCSTITFPLLLNPCFLPFYTTTAFQSYIPPTFS